MLSIVRGDLKNKPVSSKKLADFFESVKGTLEGTLYIGYPIIGTAQGGFQIDALLVCKEKGLVAFHIVEGVDNSMDFHDTQDESYTKILSKLTQYKELTHKKNLAININIVTYAPAWKSIEKDEEYPCTINDTELKSFLDGIAWDKPQYYEMLLSVLQSITTIRKNKPRTVQKVDSRGAKLQKLEESIANLDSTQNEAVIETVEGVQRIRGLAGSGKTIILALKVAYLHAKNPQWKIAVTFNTRSLKEQFKRLIRTFTYEHINEEPNWDNIDIYHAWGATSSDGIYLNVCKDHNIEYIDFTGAKRYTSVYGQEFDAVCKKALGEIKVFQQKYDLIVIDEAQDFSKEFLQICYHILKLPKRLVYAYDELQSLSKKSMDTPENVFGNDKLGNPHVKLKNESNQPKQDIVLYKCYRNSKEILTTAHALGFGIYRDEGLVQMFEQSSLWGDIGYKLIDGELKEDTQLTMIRDNETSPDFLSNHSPVDDLIKFEIFDDNMQQVDYVVQSIKKNIQEDELRLDDIIVINTDPLTTKKVVGAFREKLYELGINSNLAGVSTSQDIFYTDDAVTFTGIFRAKGNEAAMVYIINSQYCYSGYELAKKRNILFTAMTRSKAWVRVCGYGEDMQGLKNEYERVKENNFQLKFTYPTKEQMEHMNIVNRDMSPEEKNKIKKNEKNLSELLDDLKNGKLKKEDLPKDLIEQLKELI
ncbi:MAG: ATP-binding domain-containing protein [Arcobacteraceae bacterium]|jgi:superfamily I DNA and RNA helicase|nr:ATP-binding domain-containing protein [Arcobacteraceae bacterium]